LKLQKANFSNLIPNVFNSGGMNNGLVNISIDNGVNWLAVQLPNGVYTIATLNAAINAAITAVWTSPASSGFLLAYNTATNLVYTSLDSTKLLVAGQLVVDYSVSDIWRLLGYTATKVFNIDGLWGAPSAARINWFGDSISLNIIGLGIVSVKNGVSSYEIANIPLVLPAGSNEYLFPTSGIWLPELPLPSASTTIQQINFQFRSTGQAVDVNGNAIPILFLEGDIHITIEITIDE
jgi:hypothetical protein